MSEKQEMNELEEYARSGSPAGTLCLRCKTFSPGCEHACDCHTPRRYYRIESISQGGSYVEPEESIPALLDMLRECDTGDGYRVSVVMMTPIEFDALPEFTGF